MRESVSARKAAVLAAVIPMGIALIIAAVFLIAPAAHAAPETAPSQPVQFSADGVHWSDSYSGALFGGVLLVPGGSATRSFFVRNGTTESALLRVTLYDVTTTDTALATAISVSTSMPGRPGAAVPVTDARPCATLSQGQLLAAGDGVRLDNVAALADLNGTSGQVRNVSFKLAVSLSSTDSAAPAPNSCPTDFDTGTVVAVPPAVGSPSRPVYHLGATGWTPVSGSAAAQIASPPAPEKLADPALVVNTERLYQENIVAVWLAMVVVGVVLFLVVRRRRRNDDAFDTFPYSAQPTSQIGTGR